MVVVFAIALGLLALVIKHLCTCAAQDQDELKVYGECNYEWGIDTKRKLLLVKSEEIAFDSICDCKYSSGSKTPKLLILYKQQSGEQRGCSIYIHSEKEGTETKELLDKIIKKHLEKYKFGVYEAEIIDFARGNKVYLKSLYEKREEAFKLASISLPRIYDVAPPTYTRGLVKGSLADNVSVLANAQKKADYEAAVLRRKEEFSRGASVKCNARREYEKYAKQIIEKLRKLPNSEKYVEYEEEKLKKREASL